MPSDPIQRVFITGGAGFVGSAVIDELLARDYAITALVHRGDLKQSSERIRLSRVDIFDERALAVAMKESDAIIHLIGIIREKPSAGVTYDRMHIHTTRHMIAAARSAGVKRFIHMSALGVRPNAVSQYHRTKFKAEEFLRKSDLEWTIFRPSLIHGPDGEFLRMEAAWARGSKPPFLFMPYFGGGVLGLAKPKLVQPVYVKDVARAFVDALSNPKTIGQTYDLAGAQVLTWPQMHKIASEVFTGKKKAAIPIPAWYASALTHVLPAALLPFTRDQVIMAQEDNAGDLKPFVNDFGWEPGGFEQTLRGYATEMHADRTS